MVLASALVALAVAPWSHPLAFAQLPGWQSGHSGNTRSAYVGDRPRAKVPLESTAWIATGVHYRDDPTADPPNKTIVAGLPRQAVIVWAVIYQPTATADAPIRLKLSAARRLACCEAARVAGGDWELSGTGLKRAYSVIVRIYFGAKPTAATRAKAQRALARLKLPAPR